MKRRIFVQGTHKGQIFCHGSNRTRKLIIDAPIKAQADENLAVPGQPPEHYLPTCEEKERGGNLELCQRSIHMSIHLRSQRENQGARYKGFLLHALALKRQGQIWHIRSISYCAPALAFTYLIFTLEQRILPLGELYILNDFVVESSRRVGACVEICQFAHKSIKRLTVSMKCVHRDLKDMLLRGKAQHTTMKERTMFYINGMPPLIMENFISSGLLFLRLTVAQVYIAPRIKGLLAHILDGDLHPWQTLEARSTHLMTSQHHLQCAHKSFHIKMTFKQKRAIGTIGIALSL